MAVAIGNTIFSSDNVALSAPTPSVATGHVTNRAGKMTCDFAMKLGWRLNRGNPPTIDHQRGHTDNGIQLRLATIRVHLISELDAAKQTFQVMATESRRDTQIDQHSGIRDIESIGVISVQQSLHHLVGAATRGRKLDQAMRIECIDRPRPIEIQTQAFSRTELANTVNARGAVLLTSPLLDQFLGAGTRNATLVGRQLKASPPYWHR